MNDDLFQSDAETAVLTIILQEPDKSFELMHLKPFMFASTANQLLFATIQELLSEKLFPEVNLIDSFLKTKNRDKQVGGRDYLNYLLSLQFSHDNLKKYESVVVNSYKARTLLTVSNKLGKTIMETKDIDSVITGLRTALDSLTETAGGDTTASIEDILRTSWEGIKDRIKNPGIRGVTTGLKNLDLGTAGINPGEEWFIGARPSMGKTALMCNMILNQASRGIPVLVFSLEMNKAVLAERLIAIDTGIDSTNIRLGLLNQENLDKVSTSIAKIKDYPIHIDSNYYANMEYVTSTTRKYSRFSGIKVVYLDYIQLLAARNQDATNELGRISREFKLLSNDLGIGSVILSQLNRGVEMREDKRPVMSDMRQSGNLEEDGDVFIGLYRDVKYNKQTKYPDEMEAIILKQRSGPTGTVRLKFDDPTNKILDK